MITAIGICGAAIILLAFFLSEFHIWSSDSVIYEFTNFIGAVILTAYSWLLQSWPFLILNVIWGAVALYELVKLAQKKTPKRSRKHMLGHKRKRKR
jgi:hypothetical protein